MGRGDKEWRKLNVVDGEAIQWQIKGSWHDRCPECGGDVGYIAQWERMCLGECGDGLGWKVSKKDRRKVLERVERRLKVQRGH